MIKCMPKRAFVHWYIAKEMEESGLVESRENVG